MMVYLAANLGDRGSKLEEGSISELAKVESSQIVVMSFQENP